MEHTATPAHRAEAWRSRAEPLEATYPGIGSIVDQPVFAPISRRELMTAVNIAAPDLGLKPSTVLIVDALLSCLPCRSSAGAEIPVSPTMLLTIYAANNTLCFRAKGVTERQLRRHIQILEEAGLLTRRDSANGKRFPIMRGGKVVGAFGLDLSPLLVRHREIQELARLRTQAQEELRGLKAQILKLGAACQALQLTDASKQFVESLRKVTRRARLTITEAKHLLERLLSLAGHSPAPVENPQSDPRDQNSSETNSPTAKPRTDVAPRPTKPAHTTASDGRNVRHKKTEEPDPKKAIHPPDPRAWTSLTTISALYPTEPTTSREAAAIAYDLGQMLRVSRDFTTEAIATHGLHHVLKAMDRLATRAEGISAPRAYLRHLLTHADMR
ncbi:MAG: replication protein C [Rhodovulum sulfidophilum]|uniref:Replication protein C n=1 Tax=Rhodovulum sulfidophilum TaxID=35806 RepID=A0A2W5N874_RHOSU|nr:MAG: replication protein C [Rhodovulum sulfidophilum]